MLNDPTCPRCRMTVAEERLQIMPFICDHCGFAIATEANQISIEKSDSRKMIVGAFAFVALFIAANSNLEVRWLKLRQSIGLSSLEGLERLTKLCTAIHDHTCVENALKAQAKKDPRRSVVYGEYLISKLRFKDAAKAMKTYIARGKADARALTTYGQALAELGQIDEASKHFDRALVSNKPSVEHIQTYIKYLTRAKKFDQALSVILRVRKTQYNALPVEYRVISEMRMHANNRIMASKR